MAGESSPPPQAARSSAPAASRRRGRASPRAYTANRPHRPVGCAHASPAPAPGPVRGLRPLPVARGHARPHRSLRARAVRRRGWGSCTRSAVKTSRPTSARATSRSSASRGYRRRAGAVVLFGAALAPCCGSRRRRSSSATSATRGAVIRSSAATAPYQAVYEVNGLPSIELPYVYPALPRATLAKIARMEAGLWRAPTASSVPSEVIAGCVQATRTGPRPEGDGDPERRRPAGPGRAPAGRSRSYLLYFGALQPWQGFDDALRAFARLRDLDDLRLVVCSSVHPRKAKPYRRLAGGSASTTASSGTSTSTTPSSPPGASTRPCRWHRSRTQRATWSRAARRSRSWSRWRRRPGRRLRPAGGARAHGGPRARPPGRSPSGRASWPARSGCCSTTRTGSGRWARSGAQARGGLLKLVAFDQAASSAVRGHRPARRRCG